MCITDSVMQALGYFCNAYEKTAAEKAVDSVREALSDFDEDEWQEMSEKEQESFIKRYLVSPVTRIKNTDWYLKNYAFDCNWNDESFKKEIKKYLLKEDYPLADEIEADKDILSYLLSLSEAVYAYAYKEGSSEGYERGYEEGYEEGYNVGLEEGI